MEISSRGLITRRLRTCCWENNSLWVGFMRFRHRWNKSALLLLLILAAGKLWAQGPPYQTDDPVPVDLHHYEFYVFGSTDGTPVETDATVPAFEFNWGAIPRVQLHAILPLGVIAPSNNPVYLPGGTGPSAYGLTDMELGAKIAYIKESKYIPQIGTFTMFEMPTGNYSQGTRRGEGLVQASPVAAKKYRTLAAGRRRRRNDRPADRLSRLSVRRIPAEIYVPGRSVGVGRRGVCPRQRRASPHRKHRLPP